MISEENVFVAGLPLPAVLMRAINDGRWKLPLDLGRIESVFHDKPTHPRFYSLEGIVRETAHWHSLQDPEILQWYLGSPENESSPGDISQAESVLIGDLGPDSPFALDYRRNPARPTVVYLTVYSGWLEIAPDIDALLLKLGLQDFESCPVERSD